MSLPLIIDTDQKVLERNFMFLREVLPGTGGEADYFVAAYCLTCLYLAKVAANAAHSQKNYLKLDGP